MTKDKMQISYFQNCNLPSMLEIQILSISH